MGIIVDLILLLIIALNAFIGYKKGLIKVAFNILAFVISLVLTLILFKPVSYFIINNTQIVEKVNEIIIRNNTFKDNEPISDNDENSSQKEEQYNFIQKYVQNMITEKTKEAKNEALEVTANIISIKFVEIITAIFLFAVVRVLIIFLKFLSDIISELPIIKQFNEVGGIIYGLLKSVIIIFLILTIIFVVYSIKGSGVINNAIEESYITKFLYNNIIVKYCFLNKNLV